MHVVNGIIENQDIHGRISSTMSCKCKD